MPAHSQHDEPVPKDFDHLRRTVNAFLIVHRQIKDFKVQFRSAKQEFVVSPAILRSPTSQHGLNSLPIASPENFRAAQSIFYPLAEEIGESDTEKFVAQHIRSVHRPLWNRINQSRSIDKLRLSRNDYLHEVRQLFWNCR